MEKPEKEWDVFIYHAVEDQDSFVRNLAILLTRLGLKVWYAETALQVGDSLTTSINRGLANSTAPCRINNLRFFNSKWGFESLSLPGFLNCLSEPGYRRSFATQVVGYLRRLLPS